MILRIIFIILTFWGIIFFMSKFFISKRKFKNNFRKMSSKDGACLITIAILVYLATALVTSFASNYMNITFSNEMMMILSSAALPAIAILICLFG